MTMEEMPKEEEIEILCNELKTFVEMLNTNPQELLTKQVLLMISSSLIDEDIVSKDEAKDILNWWKDSITTKQLMEFLFKRDHKVNGDYNNWSCGFLGSRWVDTIINQKDCRIAFYSRKSNAQNFINNRVKENHQFIVMISEVNEQVQVVPPPITQVIQPIITQVIPPQTLQVGKKKETIPKVVEEEPIPKFEEKKVSPQKRTQIANEKQEKKRKRQEEHLKIVEEKEKLRYRMEQEKKQKKRKPLRVPTKP